MRRSRLGIYLITTFVLTYGFWWGGALATARGLLADGGAGAMVLMLLGGVAPAIAGYASVLVTGGRRGLSEYNGRVFAWRLRPGWYALVLLLPFAVGYTARSLAVFLHDWPRGGVLLRPWSALPVLFLLMLIGGGLEEPGWRGVALPELRRRWSPFQASLALAGIWAIWHVPLFFFPGASPYRTSFAVFAAGILGLTLVLTWIYEHTRSVLPCVLLHAASNTVAALGLPGIVARRGEEVGALAACGLLVLVGVALLAWPGRAARPAGAGTAG